MSEYEHLAQCKIQLLSAYGFELKKDMKILDFGCGKGGLVNAFNKLGYDAYGCDFDDIDTIDADHYKKIELDPYHLPYEDNSFDFVYSTSVFEHVMNKEESLKEIYRVLKPGGFTLHSLPSRYRFIEPHEKIPFGGLIHNDFWIKLWAFLGVRNVFQKGLSWREVYRRDKGYFRDCLNYLSYKDFKKIILSVFSNVNIVGKEYVEIMPGGAAKLGRILHLPGYSRLLFFFREWNIYMRKEG